MEFFHTTNRSSIPNNRRRSAACAALVGNPIRISRRITHQRSPQHRPASRQRQLAERLIAGRRDWMNRGALIERMVYCTAFIDKGINPQGWKRQTTYISALRQHGSIAHLEVGRLVARVRRGLLATAGATAEQAVRRGRRRTSPLGGQTSPFLPLGENTLLVIPTTRRPGVRGFRAPTSSVGPAVATYPGTTATTRVSMSWARPSGWTGSNPRKAAHHGARSIWDGATCALAAHTWMVAGQNDAGRSCGNLSKKETLPDASEGSGCPTTRKPKPGNVPIVNGLYLMVPAGQGRG